MALLSNLVTVAWIGSALALSCWDSAKMVPAVAGPIQLDTASITVTLETPCRHDGDETRLCLALGRERYELASPGFPDRSSDDHGAQVRRIDTARAPISALRLRSSGPLTVDRVVWYVHF